MALSKSASTALRDNLRRSKAADASQFTGEAAEWIVLEVRYRFWNVPEVLALALGIIGIGPLVTVEHAPKCIAVNHGEIGDDGDDNVLHAFVVKRAREMVMIDHVVALVRPENHGDHMSAQKFALLYLLVLPPVLSQALALFLHLSHSNRHLGWMQREDRNRLKDRFTRIRHDFESLSDRQKSL